MKIIAGDEPTNRSSVPDILNVSPQSKFAGSMWMTQDLTGNTGYSAGSPRASYSNNEFTEIFRNKLLRQITGVIHKS